MKILLEERDINYINRVNEDLANGELPPLFMNEVGKDYYINLTCLDIAKANSFILDLCAPAKVEEMEEKFGIRFNSINYCHGDNKLIELKDYLQRFLDDLNNV